MEKTQAQAIAAVICRALDYLKVSTHPANAEAADKNAQAEAQAAIAEALEALPDES